METLGRRHRKRLWYLGPLAMLLSIAGLMPLVARAQQATANVSGVVKDPNGAVVANVQVERTNVNTGVVRRTVTNSDGIYDFPTVVSGTYSMQASAEIGRAARRLIA